MKEEVLDIPIPAKFRKGREVYTVKSVREAAELLMDPLWPVRGPAHRRACELVMARSQNRDAASLEAICEAFSAAVEEADRVVDIPVEVDCDTTH